LHVDLILTGAALATLWFVLCRHLSNEWSANEQYNYGWFVPIFALYLFWLRWEDRPQADGRSKMGEGRWATAFAILALLFLLPLRVFEIGNPDWRPLGWVHTGAVAGFTLIYIWSVGGKPWLRHFAFPVGFFFVAVPWISPIEEPIVQGLMRIVAAVAAETLSLFGIPAQLEGNLIRVHNGLVGVNEACSGVRSLQTSIMIGLLFGELKRLSILRRIGLVVAAVAIALLANFARAFFLVWIAASKGLTDVGRWHDLAGYLIVAAVFGGSLLLANAFARSKAKSRKAKVENGAAKTEDSDQTSETSGQKSAADHSSFVIRHSSFLSGALVWLVAVEVASTAWYRAHEKDLVSTQPWEVRWPEAAPGFREIKVEENVKTTLRFDKGREAAWREAADGVQMTCMLFFFRWEPGTSTILRARAHRPDICLPSAGWRQLSDRGFAGYPAANDLRVSFRHTKFVQTQTGLIAHTFFCLQEDRRNRAEPKPDLENANGVQPDWSFRARSRGVFNGVRNLGQQVLECVLVSPHELDDAAAEQKFSELVQKVIKPPS
jgi:exosortase